MTTRTNATNAANRRLGHVALGLGVLLAAGCTKVLKPAFSDRYTFTITFRDGCPASVEVDNRNCDPPAPDCVRARKGETVVFVASPATTPPAKFELQFDPFKSGLIQANGGSVSLRIDAPANPKKGYPFSVLSGSCTPRDPWIIVEQ